MLIHQNITEVWNDISQSDDSDVHDGSSLCINQSESISQPFLTKLLFFVFLWQSVFRISEAAVSILLRFLKFFLSIIGSPQSQSLARAIPLTTCTAEKYIGLSNDDIVKYVVCKKCHTLYYLKDCIDCGSREEPSSKCCQYVQYPNHTIASKRKECGAVLLKRVKSKGKTRLQPFIVYPYLPLRISLQHLFLKPGFISLCERWRDRKNRIPPDILSDVYDGKIWQKNESFLSQPYSYLLCLNVDWFQPFKHTEHSTGAIYLVIQNLPRTERYKEENVLLVGVIPGPREPKLSINSYIMPLVEELKEFYYKGVVLRSPQGNSITVRLMLAYSSCDIPASRKVFGFLGHNARLGCNKCLKEFIIKKDGVNDYSGYDRDSWTLRTSQQHKEDCEKVLANVTKTSIQSAESKHGVRFSSFLF